MKPIDRIIHVLILCIGFGLVLAGCVSTRSDVGPSVVVPSTPVVVTPSTVDVGLRPTLDKVSEIIIDIREYTEKGCNFVPTEGFLTNMLASVSYVGDAISYARAICDAALKPLPRAAARSRSNGNLVTLPTSINGVRIQGRFVR